MSSAADGEDLCSPVVVALGAAVALYFAADRGRTSAKPASDFADAEALFQKNV